MEFSGNEAGRYLDWRGKQDMPPASFMAGINDRAIRSASDAPTPPLPPSAEAAPRGPARVRPVGGHVGSVGAHESVSFISEPPNQTEDVPVLHAPGTLDSIREPEPNPKDGEVSDTRAERNPWPGGKIRSVLCTHTLEYAEQISAEARKSQAVLVEATGASVESGERIASEAAELLRTPPSPERQERLRALAGPQAPFQASILGSLTDNVVHYGRIDATHDHPDHQDAMGVLVARRVFEVAVRSNILANQPNDIIATAVRLSAGMLASEIAKRNDLVVVQTAEFIEATRTTWIVRRLLMAMRTMTFQGSLRMPAMMSRRGLWEIGTHAILLSPSCSTQKSWDAS